VNLVWSAGDSFQSYAPRRRRGREIAVDNVAWDDLIFRAGDDGEAPLITLIAE
jgi:hypothetical protein